MDSKVLTTSKASWLTLLSPKTVNSHCPLFILKPHPPLFVVFFCFFSVCRLSCPAVILIWVRLLKYARAFHSIGPLIAIIGHLIGDILRYFVLYGIFLVPYVICFWVVFGGERAAGLPYNDELTKVYRTAIMVFRMSLIDEYPFPVRAYTCMLSNAFFFHLTPLYVSLCAHVCSYLLPLMN